MKKTARNMVRNSSGAAAVEFALIAPILLLMVLGITEMGKMVHIRSVLESAARAGTQAAFNASMTTAAEITTAEATMETRATTAITNSGIGGVPTVLGEIGCHCSGDPATDFNDCVSLTCATGEKRYIARVTVSRPFTPLVDMSNLPGGFSVDLSMTLTGNSTLWVK